MAEEEVAAEMEAVQAVYGDDCQVVEAYPPHLHVHLKPRTADVSSQQFVEATIGMRAGPQYPEEPPEISIIDSKGLDEQRQKHLLASIRDKALELVSCLMLVALCEEAVERLSSMNHPDGNCPLCLCPLLDEDAGSNALPFMKLMSCFHCFHCVCILRWWNWIHQQGEKDNTCSSSSSSIRIMQSRQDPQVMEQSMGKCPVCRKVFLAKDIEHVLDLVGNGHCLKILAGKRVRTQSSSTSPLYMRLLKKQDSDDIEIDGDVLHSESEKTRRQKFEAILKLQQESSGLIEPKKDEVLLPGMFLPQSVPSPSTESDMISSESQSKDPVVKSHKNPGSSFNGTGSRKNKNPNMRKHRSQNSGKQVRHWIRKDTASEN